MATINGDNRPNTLTGTAQADLIRGFGGNDVLNGLGGNDELRGGEGDDTANGGDGNDLLRGFRGADRLNGQAGDDQLHGEDGSDRLDGGDGRDFLFGGNGADTLLGGAGNDVLFGTPDDSSNDFATDRLFGGDGADSFGGFDASSDRFFGEGGNDSLTVNNDDASGGAGFDRFISWQSGGRVTGGANADTFENDTRGGNGAQDLVVTDFTAVDTFGWSHVGPGFFYGSGQVFDFFDSNGDGVISPADGSSSSPEGVGFAVGDTGPDLVLVIDDEDRVTFNNIGRIAAADWA